MHVQLEMMNSDPMGSCESSGGGRCGISGGLGCCHRGLVLDELQRVPHLPWSCKVFLFCWQENARFFIAKNNPLSHVRILISSVAGTGWNNQCGLSFL